MPQYSGREGDPDYTRVAHGPAQHITGRRGAHRLPPLPPHCTAHGAQRHAKEPILTAHLFFALICLRRAPLRPSVWCRGARRVRRSPSTSSAAPAARAQPARRRGGMAPAALAPAPAGTLSRKARTARRAARRCCWRKSPAHCQVYRHSADFAVAGALSKETPLDGHAARGGLLVDTLAVEVVHAGSCSSAHTACIAAASPSQTKPSLAAPKSTLGAAQRRRLESVSSPTTGPHQVPRPARPCRPSPFPRARGDAPGRHQ